MGVGVCSIDVRSFAAILAVARCILGLPLLIEQGSAESGARSGLSSEYSITVWQTENGLPQNSVNCILFSRDGYLWAGTFNGLARFDGVRFTVFGAEDGLTKQRILCLYEDRRGGLWIGTEGGGLFQYSEGRFTRYSTAEGLSRDVVLSICEDNSGNLWIGTAAWLNRWDGQKFMQYTADDGLQGDLIADLELGRDGQVWALTHAGLSVIRDGQLSQFQIDLPESSNLMRILEDENETLWIGARRLSSLAMRSGQITEYDQLTPGEIWAICRAGNGDLWVATPHGLNRRRNSQWAQFTAQDGLPNSAIRCVVEGPQGNIWLGSNGGGLIRLKRKSLTTLSTKDGLSNDVVMCLLANPEGGLWVGSNCGGLNVLESGAFSMLGGTSREELPFDACVYSLCRTQDGSLWVGVWGNSLYRYKEGRWFAYPRNEKEQAEIPDRVVLSLCEDRNGGLWIGTYKAGLIYYKDDQFKLLNEPRDARGNVLGYITSIVEDWDGNLWIASNGNGLTRKTGEQYDTFTTRDGLPSDFVGTVYRDRSEQCLWIGSSRGLCRWKGGEFKAIQSRDGLGDNAVSQILEDDLGNLWFGSSRGIFRVEKEQLNSFCEGKSARVHSVLYGKSEGMLALECTGSFQPAGQRTADGNLWFSTVKGLARVNPKKAIRHEAAAPAIIEELLVDEVRAAAADTDNTQRPWPGSRGETFSGSGTVIIPPGSKRIEIHYTSLSFSSPETVTFKHRLNNFDSEWVAAGTRRTAYYTRVPPGEYKFEVMARNSEGQWNEATASLAFVVQPFFWQTGAFQVLAVLGLVGATGILVRVGLARSHKAELRELERLHALKFERIRIAGDLHDDLGSNLASIALLSRSAQRQSSGNTAQEFQEIHRLAQTTVDSMRDIVWFINPNEDRVEKMIWRMRETAAALLSGLDWKLTAPEPFPDEQLSSEFKRHFLLIYKEALHNIVKHSRASRVRIEIRAHTGKPARKLEVTIADNGVGFEPDGNGSGHYSGQGLRSMRRRANALNWSLQIKSGPGEGTIVELSAPLDMEPPAIA